MILCKFIIFTLTSANQKFVISGTFCEKCNMLTKEMMIHFIQDSFMNTKFKWPGFEIEIFFFTLYISVTVDQFSSQITSYDTKQLNGSVTTESTVLP